MKNSTHKITFFFIPIMYLLMLGNASAQNEIIASAKLAMKDGSAEKLTQHFNEVVELNFDDEKSSYSKTQAQFVLKDFFKKYPATNFEYIHQGASREGLQYAIGKYTYDGGSFRVYMLVKQFNGKYIIDTLDFGED